MVPFDGPEWVFRQAHSLFECCIVAADAKLDFLFHQILSIQCVIERIYGKILWDLLWREEDVAVHPDWNNPGIWPKTDRFETLARCALVRALSAGLFAAIDCVWTALFGLAQELSHRAGDGSVFV